MFHILSSFEIVPIYNYHLLLLFNIHLYIFSNFFLTFISNIFILFLLDFFSMKYNKIIPNYFQTFFEILYNFIFKLNIQNTNLVSILYLPFIYSIILFFFFFNLIGLIPYNYTLTTNFIFILFFSFSIFLGTILSSINIHGIKFIQLYIPDNTPFFISFLVFFIELISYISRIFSLSIRLVANLVGGHVFQISYLIFLIFNEILNYFYILYFILKKFKF